MEHSNEFELAEALDMLIKSYTRGKTLVDGVVVAVNDDFTCDIQILGVTYSEVPLKVLIGSQATIYEVPEINSACLVVFRDGDQHRPQIMMVDKVKDYYINISGTLDITANEVQFNGGLLGGMVKVNDLLSRLNNIENKYNDLVSLFNAHTHILALTSGTGTAAPPATAGTPTDTTTLDEIQNTKIKQ